MKIETQFNVGDIVYWAYCNELKKGIVTDIQINYNKTRNELYVLYEVNHNRQFRSETYFWKDKEELKKLIIQDVQNERVWNTAIDSGLRSHED